MEQSEDDESEDKTTTAGRPVSIAVRAEPKQDGNDSKEFHLQIEESSPVDVDISKTNDDFVTSYQVNGDSGQAKVLLNTVTRSLANHVTC